MKKNKTVIIILVIIGIIILGIIGLTIYLNSIWNKTSDKINELWGEPANNSSNISESEQVSEAKKFDFKMKAESIADYLEEQYQSYMIGLDTDITIPYTETKMTDSDFELAGEESDNFATGYWYIDSETGKACVTIYSSTFGEYSGVGETKSYSCD